MAAAMRGYALQRRDSGAFICGFIFSNMYLSSRRSTRITRIARIFTDTFNPCVSVSSVKSVFYCSFGSVILSNRAPPEHASRGAGKPASACGRPQCGWLSGSPALLTLGFSVPESTSITAKGAKNAKRSNNIFAPFAFFAVGELYITPTGRRTPILINAANLVREHPEFLELKMMESLGKLADRGNSTVIPLPPYSGSFLNQFR